MFHNIIVIILYIRSRLVHCTCAVPYVHASTLSLEQITHENILYVLPDGPFNWRSSASISRYGVLERGGCIHDSAVLADGVFHHMYAEFYGLHIAEAWRSISTPEWSSWVLVGQGLMFAKRDAH
ncbi:hypothetical protein F5Y12DRAFT_727289 [Xylaria sp. FL1777]|nr:hypothetical protein F5Y12DRAFT_727289 [Xylaria sp. FL1777]